MTTGWTIFCIASCILSFWLGYAACGYAHIDDHFDIEGDDR